MSKSKVLGKSHSNSGTHAHYAGEFGAQKMTKKLEKDPAYRVARAEHFAKMADEAKLLHSAAISKSDKASHALVIVHAAKMAAKHANALKKLVPGEKELIARGVKARDEAKKIHDEISATPKPPVVTPKPPVVISKPLIAQQPPKSESHAEDSLSKNGPQYDHSKFAQALLNEKSSAPSMRGYVRQLTLDAQKAVRSHHRDILQQYGMTSHDKGAEADVLILEKMAGTRGTHYQSGEIILRPDVVEQLRKFASQDPRTFAARLADATPPKMEQMMLDLHAYRTSTHESIHGMGPKDEYKGMGVVIEEVATEMCARRVTCDVVGANRELSDRLRSTASYNHYIEPVVKATAHVTGLSHQDAYSLVEKASLSHKQRSQTDPTTADRASADFSRTILSHASEFAASMKRADLVLASIDSPTKHALLTEMINDIRRGQ